MIILNETIIIEPAIESSWLKWLHSNHIPAVLATGYFTACRILTVVNSPNEGITYCVQYTAPNIDQYNQYQNTDANRIKQAHLKEFENKFVMFESIMEIVGEYESN